MSRSVYLTAMGPASGKSIVALGLVELLSRRVSRIGFFRPIVQALPDNDTELIRARYRLADDQVGFAFTADELRSLVSGTRDVADAGMAQAVAAFKALEARCDVVVIEGTDFTGPSSPLEFDFNARVARHLGAPGPGRHQRARPRRSSRSRRPCGSARSPCTARATPSSA